MEGAAFSEREPRWKRVVQFPLVAMLIAAAVMVGGLTAAAFVAQWALPTLSWLTPQVKFDLVGAVVLVLLYKLAIRHLGRDPRDDLRGNDAGRQLAIGLAAGLLVFAVAVAIAAAADIYNVVGEGDFRGLWPALVTAALFPAISEEMLFRGVLFRWIEEFGGSWAALVLTSAMFGMVHLANPHASPIAALGIACEAGVMLGAAYMLTRSLWLPMGLHAGWNLSQGEVFDIPVSGTEVHGLVDARLSGPPLWTGNGFGLEASPIAMVVATLFGIALLWLAIRRGELVRPSWVRRRGSHRKE